MNRLLIAALAAGTLIACSGGDDSDSDGDADTDADTDPDGHPLIPEEFKYLWSTEGCDSTDADGNPVRGDRVYRYTFDIESAADGSLSGTETWVWMHDGEGWNGDCADTFSFSGEYYSRYGDICQPCEEGYDVTRTLIDSQCDYPYDSILGADPPPQEPGTSWRTLFAFDSLNPNGDPNPDNRILAYDYTIWGTSAVPNGDAARGTAEYLGDLGTYPGKYEWWSEKCVVWTDGGGGT